MTWKVVSNLESGKFVKLTSMIKHRKDKLKIFGKILLKTITTMELLLAQFFISEILYLLFLFLTLLLINNLRIYLKIKKFYSNLLGYLLL